VEDKDKRRDTDERWRSGREMSGGKTREKAQDKRRVTRARKEGSPHG
jgi:hypothetical protein